MPSLVITAIYNQSGAGLSVSRRTVGNIDVPVEHPDYILAEEEFIEIPDYSPEDSARDFVEVAGQEGIAYLLWAWSGGSACFLAATDRDLTDVMNGQVALGDTGAQPVSGDSDGAGNVALYVTDLQGGLKLDTEGAVGKPK